MKTFFGILIVLIGLVTILIGVVIGNDPEISFMNFIRLHPRQAMELFGEGWLYIFGGILIVLIGVLILIVKTRKLRLVGAGFKRNSINYSAREASRTMRTERNDSAREASRTIRTEPDSRTEIQPMVWIILAIGFIAIGAILFAVSFDAPLPEWLPELPAVFGE